MDTSQGLLTDPVSLLPDVDTLEGKHRVIRRLRILDLRKTLQDLGAQRDWVELTIYADEVQLDLTGDRTFGFDLTDRSRFTLLTRKLTILGDGRFVLLTATPGSETVVELAIQEFVGPPIGFATAGGSKNLAFPAARADAKEPRAVEVRVELDTSVTSNALERGSLGWRTGSEFYWSLVSAFQHGFIRMDTDRDEARRTFLWVYENTRDASWWADANVEMLSMATQSLAMVSRLARKPPPYEVPIRDLRALKQTIEARMSAASRLEVAYETFVDRKLDAKSRAEAMRRAIVEARAQEQETDRQLAQVQAELATAEEAARKDIERVRDQNKKLADAAHEFEKGKRMAELIAVAKALGALGTSIATLASGDAPAAAATTFKFIIPEKPSRIDKLIAAIMKIGEPLKKLARVAVVLKDAYNVGTKVKGAFDPNRSLRTFKEDEEAVKLTAVDWKVLREAFDAALSPYTAGEDKIEGASEYLEAGRVLVIYGEAVHATHLTIARLHQRVIHLTSKKAMHEAQQQRLDGYKNSESVVEEALRDAELLLRQRYLDVKRAVLFELEDFNDAYRYWALREPPSRRFSVNSRVAEMAELKVELQHMIDIGVSALFPVKQQRIVAHILYRPTAEEKKLLARGEAVVIGVRPTTPGLKGWTRVRIDDVERIVLDDLAAVATNLDKNYRCHLRSSGAFTDSWDGKAFAFVAPASQELGQSRVVTASEAQDRIAASTILTVDGGGSGGDLGQLNNVPYYLPGLFTDWSLWLPRGLGDNDSLDLSALVTIKLRLSGWAMSHNIG
jgi:hypothetical protein